MRHSIKINQLLYQFFWTFVLMLKHYPMETVSYFHKSLRWGEMRGNIIKKLRICLKDKSYTHKNYSRACYFREYRRNCQRQSSLMEAAGSELAITPLPYRIGNWKTQAHFHLEKKRRQVPSSVWEFWMRSLDKYLYKKKKYTL